METKKEIKTTIKNNTYIDNIINNEKKIYINKKEIETEKISKKQ